MNSDCSTDFPFDTCERGFCSSGIRCANILCRSDEVCFENFQCFQVIPCLVMRLLSDSPKQDGTTGDIGDIVDIGNIQDIANIGNIQDIANIGNIQDIQDIVDIGKIVDISIPDGRTLNNKSEVLMFTKIRLGLIVQTISIKSNMPLPVAP